MSTRHWNGRWSTVLARMEEPAASRIDRPTLARLSSEFATESVRLEGEIRNLAGMPAEPGLRRNRSAMCCSDRWACPAAPRPRPGNGRPARRRSKTLPNRVTSCRKKILDWRQVSKLRSTYTDALPTYVDPKTQRVTRAIRCATTTGRLSSSEPNLQNIPIRTEAGRKIRKAFIAAGPQAGVGRLFADRTASAGRSRQRADAAPGLQGRYRYSCDDRVGNVRRAGEGHAGRSAPPRKRRSTSASSTASRRSASPIQLGIAREESGACIKKVFRALSRHPRLQWTRRASSAANTAMLETLFGRNAVIRTSALNPSDPLFQPNAPPSTRGCQGTAADIIRRAMVRMDDAL